MTPPELPACRWLDRTHIGDCRHLLRQMTESGISVQMCVTSPPYYRLRSYLPADHPDKALELGAEETPAVFVARLVEVFREVRNLLADNGTLWIVIGDTYAGTGKSGGGWQGRRWYAHGAETIGPRGGRWSPPPPGLKQKDLMGIPWMLAFALRDDGWFLRQDIIWSKPNPMPESVTDRCTRSHEYLFLLTKRRRYYFDHAAIIEPSLDPRGPGNIRQVRLPPGERSSGTNGNLRGGLHKIERVPPGASATSGRSPISHSTARISRPFPRSWSCPAFSPARAKVMSCSTLSWAAARRPPSRSG